MLNLTTKVTRVKAPFKLKSGNSTQFKTMGSSPVNKKQDFLNRILTSAAKGAKNVVSGVVKGAVNIMPWNVDRQYK